MAEGRVRRRLAAILAADVVGYSRLTEADEEGTRARIRSLHAELIDPLIEADGGRIVKSTGDGILVEFPSAVDAVRNALAIQTAMRARDANLPEERRIQFRVGINVGDVIVEGDDIHGDGVNIAARLEGLCEPGAVYVSGTVHDQVAGKRVAAFDDLGEQTVKNISKPLRVYRARTEASEPRLSDDAVVEASLPDRPSIAVLPFENVSDDAEQDYFADGIAEDIITALSRFRWFFVIARNSSFTYKGRNVDIRQVGRELGARYVLEGSVRKGGNRLRITTQLIEAATGNHLWAEKYDGFLEDIFDLQDQIAEGVVGAIEPSVRRAEIERARRKRPDSLDAYDLYLRALPHAWSYTVEGTEKAIEFLETALRIDPGYVAAHGLAAWCNSNFTTLVPGHPRRAIAVQHARAVLVPDTDDPLAQALAGWVLAYFERDYDVALDAVNRALASTPYSPFLLAISAVVHAYSGRYEIAIEQAEASLRLGPSDPMRFHAELAVAYGHFFSERYDDAAEAARRCSRANSQFIPAVAVLVAGLTLGGRTEEAHAAVERLLGLSPKFSVGDYISWGRFEPARIEKLAAALREAGLPE